MMLIVSIPRNAMQAEGSRRKGATSLPRQRTLTLFVLSLANSTPLSLLYITVTRESVQMP